LAAARLGVSLSAEVDRQHGQVSGIEPRVDPLRVLKTAEKEARTDQRDERQRQLRGDEHAAQAHDAIGAALDARLLLELDDKVRSRRLKGGHEAKHNSGCSRHCRRKSKDTQIRMEIDRIVL